MNISFSYGTKEQSFDVTEEARKAFIKRDRLVILKSANFNEIFGDVAPNQVKTLRVLFSDDNFARGAQQRLYFINIVYQRKGLLGWRRGCMRTRI